MKARTGPSVQWGFSGACEHSWSDATNDSCGREQDSNPGLTNQCLTVKTNRTTAVPSFFHMKVHKRLSTFGTRDHLEASYSGHNLGFKTAKVNNNNNNQTYIVLTSKAQLECPSLWLPILQLCFVDNCYMASSYAADGVNRVVSVI